MTRNRHSLRGTCTFVKHWKLVCKYFIRVGVKLLECLVEPISSVLFYLYSTRARVY